MPSSRDTPRAVLPWKRPPTPRALALAVAVLVVLALLAIIWSAQQDAPDAARRARIDALAAVRPPAPSPEAIRAAAADAAYAQGLEAYAARRWPEAIAALSGVDRPDARFYRALAHLMQGDPTSSDALLADVQQSDAPLYAREAVFYRVKALLAGHNARAAQALVADAVRLGAGPPGEAEQMRDALEILRP